MHEILSKNITESNGSLTVVVSRLFQAPPEKIFKALTHRDHLSKWYGCPFTMDEVAKVGGKYLIDFGLKDKTEGEFVAVNPSDLISFTWSSVNGESADGAPVRDTVVKIEIKKEPKGTNVTLTHSGFKSARAANSHDEGWSIYMDMWQEHRNPDTPIRRIGQNEVYDHTPAQLKKNFTESTAMTKWFGEPVEADSKGFKINFGENMIVTGKYLSIDDKHVRMTWLTPNNEDTELVVKFEPMIKGTRLTVVHFGFATDAQRADCAKSWGEYFKTWKTR